MKKAITIFALIILYICSKAQQGEIIYVDYEPDWIAQDSFDTLWIDFDQDGGCLALIMQECPNTD